MSAEYICMLKHNFLKLGMGMVVMVVIVSIVVWFSTYDNYILDTRVGAALLSGGAVGLIVLWTVTFFRNYIKALSGQPSHKSIIDPSTGHPYISGSTNPTRRLAISVLVAVVFVGVGYWVMSFQSEPVATEIGTPEEPTKTYNQTTVYYVGSYFMTALCIDGVLLWSYGKDVDCDSRKEEDFLRVSIGPFFVVPDPDSPADQEGILLDIQRFTRAGRVIP